jgi:hypothetical protein
MEYFFNINYNILKINNIIIHPTLHYPSLLHHDNTNNINHDLITNIMILYHLNNLNFIIFNCHPCLHLNIVKEKLSFYLFYKHFQIYVLMVVLKLSLYQILLFLFNLYFIMCKQ